MRFRQRFIPSGGGQKGFRFLLEKSSYFPLADHGLLQNMTGPGHAGILSGTYPYRHGISTNYWFNGEKLKNQYCVADDDTRLIGSDSDLKDPRPGMSPRHFNASTIGDELKNVDRASRVVSLSLKDRAAVLLGGKRADVAIWFSEKNCQWVTSDFYTKKLPDFANKRNESIRARKGSRLSFGTLQNVEVCSKESLRTSWGIEETFSLALSAVDELGLGRGKDTDLLLVSLSSHDYLGHQFGPNHANLEEMTLAEDRLVSKFLGELSKKVPGGLQDVFLVLTGDHGVTPSALPPERVPTENVSEGELRSLAEKTLREAWGAPKGGKWIDAVIEFQLYLNAEAMRAAGVTPSKALVPLREKLLKERYADQVWARDEIMNERKIPAGEYGLVADRTLSRRSGDIIVVLRPYFFSDSYPHTHMTQYSYDRYVPLLFYGRTFKPGTYRQIVNIVDIAPTLASVLNVIPPSQSEGRILTEILR
jgi:predicted AlkP superfamily pyrophosphatase or phosphodiesterase